MSHRIVLTILTGPHRQQKFVFDRQTCCLAGRAEDCLVRLFGDLRDMQVSRHHCQLKIDPPHIWVQDLESKNGTYINGTKVEPCDCALKRANPSFQCPGLQLQNGDILTLGGSTLQVSIVEEEQEAATLVG